MAKHQTLGKQPLLLTWAWAMPMLIVMCWPLVLGPSLTVVPFAAGLLAAALVGMVFRPTLPLASLGWLALVVVVAWLSGGSDMGYLAGLLAAAAACGVLLGMGHGAFNRPQITQAFVGALVLAMAWHVAVAWLQWFDLERAFHPLANMNHTSRPYGNLRQPNHLASFALMGLVGVWWRHQRGLDARSVTVLLALLACSGIALSGSRTGLLATVAVSAGLVLLLRRPGRFVWCVFFVAPLWVILIAWGVTQLPLAAGVDSEALMARGSSSLSVRFAYWAEAWELALRHPLLGVGWGELGRARFELLPPQQGLQNTINAHNLVLHLLAELGFLGATAVLAPVARLLWRRHPWRRVQVPGNQSARDTSDLTWAWLVLVVAALHSLSEYPLWYMPFLIPTAYAFGLLLASAPDPRGGRLSGRAMASGAAALLACTVLALVDYAHVSTAFGPSGRSLDEPARAWAVQDTVLFQRYADRALLERVPATASNLPQVLAATSRLLSGGPNTLLLWVRLSALCEAGRKAEAGALDARFKALYPVGHARFVSMKNPVERVQCGLQNGAQQPLKISTHQ